MEKRTTGLGMAIAMLTHPMRRANQPMHQPTILLTSKEVAWSEAGKIEAAEKKRMRKAAKLIKQESRNGN